MLDRGIAWNIYYYVPLGTSVISLPLIWIIFRRYTPPEEQEAKATAGGRLLLAIRSPIVLFGGLLAALVSFSARCASL
jgi:hypothetical protein